MMMLVFVYKLLLPNSVSIILTHEYIIREKHN